MVGVCSCRSGGLGAEPLQIQCILVRLCICSQIAMVRGMAMRALRWLNIKI